MQLFLRFTEGAVDHSSTLYRRARFDLPGPAKYVDVLLHLKELTGIIEPPQRQLSIPGPDGDIGNGVLITGKIARLRQAALQDVELTLGLHGETIDGVLHLERRIGVEVTEAAAKIGGAAHLPEQPVQCFGTLRRALGQKFAELLRQIEQYRARFEYPGRRRGAMIHQRRNLGVGIGLDKAAAE